MGDGCVDLIKLYGERAPVPAVYDVRDTVLLECDPYVDHYRASPPCLPRTSLLHGLDTVP